MVEPRTPTAIPGPLTNRKSFGGGRGCPDQKSAQNPRFVVKIRAEWIARPDATAQPGTNDIKSLVAELLSMRQNIEILPLDVTNKADKFHDIADFPSGSERVREYFEVVTMPNPNTKYTKVPNMTVVFNLNSPISVDQIKMDPMLSEYLRENKLFIQQHWFKTPKWRIIGLLTMKHPDALHRQSTEAMLRKHLLEHTEQKLQTTNKQLSLEEIEKLVPYFELSVHRRFTRYFGQNQICTDVIGIKVDLEDTDTLESLLKEVHLPTPLFGIYVPITLSYDDTDTFLRYLRAHTRYMLKVKKIAIVGLFPAVTDTPYDMSECIEHQLLYYKKPNGEYLCQGLEHHWSTEKKGLRYFLVADSDFPAALTLIDEQLPKWISELKASGEVDWSSYPASLQHPRRSTQPIKTKPTASSQLQPIASMFDLPANEEEDVLLRAPKRTKQDMPVPTTVRKNAWTSPTPSTITQPSTQLSSAMEQQLSTLRSEMKTQENRFNAALKIYEEKAATREEQTQKDLETVQHKLEEYSIQVDAMELKHEKTTNELKTHIVTGLADVNTKVDNLAAQVDDIGPKMEENTASMVILMRQLFAEQNVSIKEMIKESSAQPEPKRYRVSRRLPLTAADRTEMELDNSSHSHADRHEKSTPQLSVDPHEATPEGSLRGP